MHDPKIKMFIYKLWLVLFSLIFLHSMFPPRVQAESSQSAGRSFVLWDRFYKTDYMVIYPSETEDEVKLAQFKSLKYHEWNGYHSTAWNMAKMNWPVFVAELILLLSVGVISSLWVILQPMRQAEKIEQSSDNTQPDAVSEDD